MAELFRNDKQDWTPADFEELHYMFQCNSFFSPIYEYTRL